MLPAIYGENMFDDFFGTDFGNDFFGARNPLFGKNGRNLMKTDIRETDDAKAYRLAVDLPGFKKGASAFFGCIHSVGLFNGNGGACGALANLFLGHQDGQDTVFVLGLDILRAYIANIEATGANAGVALLAKDTALLILCILVKTLLGTDGQITVLNIQLDLILLEAGQVNIQLVAVLCLTDIGLHHVACVFAIQRLIRPTGIHQSKGGSKEIIKQVLTKNARQHKSFLQFI